MQQLLVVRPNVKGDGKTLRRIDATYQARRVENTRICARGGGEEGRVRQNALTCIWLTWQPKSASVVRDGAHIGSLWTYSDALRSARKKVGQFDASSMVLNEARTPTPA